MKTQEIIAATKCIPNFLGVFPRDSLPNIPSKGSCSIANTDSKYEEGEHWIAMYLDDQHGEYFDSFGLPPLHQDFIKFMKNVRSTWIFSNKDIQNYSSVSCGEFCIAFLKHRCKGLTMDSFLKMFPIGSLKNDVRVNRFRLPCEKQHKKRGKKRKRSVGK